MARELTTNEINDFYVRHRDVQRAVQNASVAMAAETPLLYPGAGVAYKDNDTYVLVWRDATKHWHFIDLENLASVETQINKPEFFSPDSSFLENALNESKKVFASIGNSLTLVASALVLTSLWRK